VRNAIDDLGFLDQVIGIALSWFGVSRGVLHNYRSICRLNLKFESSAIHTYYCIECITVRNAIDDLGFLGQVIGIELSNLGQVTGIALRLVRGVERRICQNSLLFVV